MDESMSDEEPPDDAPDAPECPFGVFATDFELEAIEWLGRVLKAIEDKDGHKNRGRALAAKNLIRRLTTQNTRMHQFAHMLMETGVIEDVTPLSEMGSDEAKQMLAELGFLSQKRGEA